MWAGAMIALYWSVVAFVFLLFGYIDYAFPNALSYYVDPYSSGMPYEMASVVVLFPVFLVLMWLIRRDIAHDRSRAEVWVRRWALILTLFIAGLSLVVDIVTLLTAFFRGEELTAAFLLKILVVLLVAAMAFMHFIADYWGYWRQYPERNRSILIAVAILALVSIVSGFFIVGTPWQARLRRFDEQKVNDLQSIQSQVVSYWQAKRALPPSLDALNSALQGFSVPADPQSGAPYEYKIATPLSFELCATFNAQSNPLQGTRALSPMNAGSGMFADTWYHDSGRTCFDRTIDPDLYPPLAK